jgi:FkbM family methyltransferase
MLAHQLKSFKGFTLIEKLRLLFSIPAKKMVNGNAENLIRIRGVLYRIIEMGGTVKNQGDCIEVSCPVSFSTKPVTFLLRKKTTDFVIFSEIILDKGGDYTLIKEIAEKNGISIHTIVDAGANIGCATVYFQSLFPGAKTICVEADKENHKVLSNNIALNKYDTVTALQKAFWNTNEELNFGIGIRGKREKELSFSVVEEGGTKVQGFTFADCLKTLSTNHIDLLKIDIEGAEKALIEDKEGFTYLLDHTQILAIELHHEVVNPLDFIEIIKNAGFSYIQYGEITICWRKLS